MAYVEGPKIDAVDLVVFRRQTNIITRSVSECMNTDVAYASG